ncbi:SDR family oxidoreductase [Streptomyces sp. NPDC055085]
MDPTAGLPGLPAPPPLGASALPAGTFDGSLVLVTGGGTGLGRAVAAEFARLGADLLIVSRRERHLGPARAELAKLGTRVSSAVCDIRDPRRIAEVFDAHALPDVLVNNAAANFPVPTEDMSPNAWQAVVDITLTGTFLMTREFGRRHLATGTPGSVIDVGASYAWTGGPGFAHSAAAKAGVESLVRTLAVEWGPYGIQVNGLVPGLMPHTDMSDDIRGNLARAEDVAESAGTDGHDRRQPALRVGAPRELGWAATFLASPYARFITGHTLVVDGANWQRRGLVSPPVTPVREQLGRGPFTG